MKNLRELYLSKNALGRTGNIDWRWLFGPQIVKTLRLLDISDNKIRYMPKAIWKLQNLVTLKINNNQLVKVPATIGRIQTLRYLDISKNQLETLPCSLMQCSLEHLDLASNNFHFASEISLNQDNSSGGGWELYIHSLTNLASKAVLKNKLFYAPNVIPWTLVQFLDDAKMCVCGNPVVNNEYIIREFDPKDYFRVVVFDYNRSVKFECFFCSAKCYTKYF